MSGGPLKPKFLFAVSLSCVLLGGLCFGKQRRSTASQPAQNQPAAENSPVAPPPTLAEQPASPPQVSFQGGELTITAQNSTLGDILKAVRAQTGATIDLPGAASERVVGHFGPAPARDVLTSLLNGSHFNYLLLGSSTDPNALDRVILIAKSGVPAESSPPQAIQPANTYNQAALARPMAPMAAPGGNTVTVEGQDADSTDDATDDSADATDDAADDSTDQTDQADDQTATDEQQQQQPDGQQSVKTPEQLLQELQQRQQQLQQQGVQPGVPPGMRQFPNPGVPGGQGGPGGPDNPAPPPHN
jgi:hypothetical protein